jgi:hypothetical protein
MEVISKSGVFMSENAYTISMIYYVPPRPQALEFRTPDYNSASFCVKGLLIVNTVSSLMSFIQNKKTYNDQRVFYKI